MRSSTGCWTCRLRRKKCDETLPVCDACAALLITCYYSDERPKWMDGGVLQAAMAEQMKRDIKARAPFRLRGPSAQQRNSGHASNQSDAIDSRVAGSASNAVDAAGRTASLPDRESSAYPQRGAARLLDVANAGPGQDCSPSGSLDYRKDTRNEHGQQSPTSTDQSSAKADSTASSHSNRVGGANIALTRSDAFMTTHFLDFVVPFLFPCYELPTVQAGRSWILEMLLSSPLIRQSATYQSEFFLWLANDRGNRNSGRCEVLAQSSEIFSTMRRALQKLIESSIVGEHLFGAARVMIGMIHWMHFELAMLRYDAWQTHLGTAATLFEEILKNVAIANDSCPTTVLSTVFDHLGSYSVGGVLGDVEIPNAEQVGLRFASAVLLFDDIIASTVLCTAPKLHKYLDDLLCGVAPILDIESSTGCRSWVLLHISEISMLCVWKRSCQFDATFNAVEHGTRAAAIRTSIERCLATLDMSEPLTSDMNDELEYSLSPARSINISMLRYHRPYITQIWAQAALLYLHVAVSGWNLASADVSHLVNQVISLLHEHIKQVTVLRTLMWPLCVAGLLAEPADQTRVLELLDTMKPRHLFPMVPKARHLLESMWKQRNEGLIPEYDFAAAFTDNDTVFLLL